MTQNSILLIILIEFILFYLIIYYLIKIDKIIKFKLKLVKELMVEIPDSVTSIRENLENFNIEFDKKYKVSPLNAKELGFITGNIFAELIKFKITTLTKNKILILLSIFIKLWKNKDKIIATLKNKRLNSF